MVRWICGVKLNDEVPTVSLYNKLGITEVSDALRSKRLRWYGHATRATSCTNATMNMTLPSTRGRGRPRKSWSDCINSDLKECCLGNTSPQTEEPGGQVLDDLAACCLPQCLGHPQQKTNQIRIRQLDISVSHTELIRDGCLVQYGRTSL